MVEGIELVLKTCLMDLTPTCTIDSYGVLSLLGTLGCGAGAYSSRRIDRSISCHLNIMNRESLQLVRLVRGEE